MSGKRVWIVLGGTIVVAGVVVFFGWRAINPKTTTTNTDDRTETTIRQHYAALYQAAWRADQGRGSVVMTATLFLPNTIITLGQDTGRTSTESQLYDILKTVQADQVGLFLTFDSVGGPLADQAIRDSLTLKADGRTFTLTRWQPTIQPSPLPTNGSLAQAQQTGVAVFTSSPTIDWATMKNVALEATNIADQPLRQFVWAKPALLVQIES